MKPKTTELLKFQRLCRRLGESKRGVVGLLELLWNGTAQNCPEGDIGRFCNEDIAIMCGWESDPDELVAALVENRWLDESTKHRLLVHDWEHHAPTYIRGNLRRWDKEFAKDSPNGSVHATLVEDATSFPIPIPIPIPPPPPKADAAWEGVEVELRKLGMTRAQTAVAKARENGCDPRDIRALISFFRSKPSAWEAGALYERILVMRRDQDQTTLWPPPSKAANASENSADRERVAAAAQRQRDIDRAALAAKDAHWAALEHEHGAAVDTLDRGQIREIARDRLGEAVAKLLATTIKKLPLPPGTLREAMLEHYAGIPVEVT